MNFRTLGKFLALLPVLGSVMLWLWSSIETVRLDRFWAPAAGSVGFRNTLRSEAEFGYWNVEIGGYSRRWESQLSYSPTMSLRDRFWCAWPRFDYGRDIFGRHFFLLLPHWLLFLLSWLPVFVLWLRGRRQRIAE